MPIYRNLFNDVYSNEGRTPAENALNRSQVESRPQVQIVITELKKILCVCWNMQVMQTDKEYLPQHKTVLKYLRILNEKLSIITEGNNSGTYILMEIETTWDHKNY